MLGREQHGHIEAIGFDLYCQMLERAVSKLKGEDVTPELRTTLNLGFDVRIPQDYIPSENLRLRTYKRISSISTEAEKQDVRKELEDRFGAPPKSVENLLEYATLKSTASVCAFLPSSARAAASPSVFIRRPRWTPPRSSQSSARERESSSTPAGSCGWKSIEENPVPETLRNVLLGLQGQS